MRRNYRKKSNDTQFISRRSSRKNKLNSGQLIKKNQSVYHSILMEKPDGKSAVNILTAPIQPDVPPMPRRPRGGKNSVRRRAVSETSLKRMEK